MQYRTILLNLNDDQRLSELTGAATFLARATEAHLIGLYAMPAALPSAEMIGPVSYTWLDTQRRFYREQAERAKAAFEGYTRDAPFPSEWRVEEALSDSTVAGGVIAHARAADLVIASQGPAQDDWVGLGEVPERVALESGRPVLVIPRTGRFDSFGSVITVAWNGTRESARAVFDALPLLQKARRVCVLTVLGDAKRAGANEVPGADIAVALTRHGVQVEVETRQSEPEGVGRTLVADMARDGTDLLVMGAYGHSRLREFILGGASRDVLRDMSVPVLMAH